MPVDAPMDAMPGELLLHEPPDVVSDNKIVLPAHTFVLPVIGAGEGFITTTAEPVINTLQPVTASVATTVYVPDETDPKLRDAPVPASADPTGVAPLNNWYITPVEEPDRPTIAGVPPLQ